ncbi:hypothetical protein EDD85DRAFT_951646 [Armillaria nabsnona]|nr:hypothetical protein EDD85DRAFT_951646 [Armillaria nabsnona]
MDCFQQLIARIQDSTITIDDRLHVHTFVQLGISGPESVSEALDADILNTVLKLDRVLVQACEAFVGILNGIQRGLTFRGVERSAWKALNTIEQHFFEADLKPGPTEDAWLATKVLAEYVHAYKIYYNILGCDNGLRCSNYQCPKASVGRHPKRCPACWITLYCSSICQKATWKEHREQCHEWVQQRKCGVSGPMGDHVLFYIQRYVLEELKANGRHIRDLKREYMKTYPDTPARRLVINCDYEKLPWTFKTISPEDIKERAAMTTPGLFDPSDKGKSQLIRLVTTPWKGGSVAMVLHLLYTPDYPSDEHLLIRGF